MLGLGLAADSEKKGFDNNETKNNSFSYIWKEINVFLRLGVQWEKENKTKVKSGKKKTMKKRDYIEETRGRVYKREPRVIACN